MSKTKEDILKYSRPANQQDLVQKIQGANRKRTIIHRVPKSETLLDITDPRVLKDVFFNTLRRCFNFKSVSIYMDTNPDSYKLQERQLLTFDKPRSNIGEPWDAINLGKEWLAGVLQELFLQERQAVGFRVTSQGIVGIFDQGKKFNRTRKATKDDIERELRVITAIVEKYRARQVDKVLHESKLRNLPEERSRELLARADTMTEAYKIKLLEKANLTEVGEEVPSDTYGLWLEFVPTPTSEYNNIERRK